MPKKRLDILLFERGLCPSRERAKTTIMSGLVYVDGQKSSKPGLEVREDSMLEVREDPIGFVSRGGLKLKKALDEFGVDPSGRNALDCGASTGGFTDCLLQRGAKHVWAIDVGYGQLAWTLRNDARVTCIERFNVRNLTKEHIGRPVDLAVIDVSFISLKIILPVVFDAMEEACEAICLVKPQFEATRELVGKNGVIRDPAVHFDILRDFVEHTVGNDISVKQITFSPIKGPKGNIEFLAHLIRPGKCPSISYDHIKEIVRNAHSELKGQEQ